MTIKAGNKLIGQGAPCFIAAEIGINHNGDMGLAKSMIDAAADCGVDAVKFQNYYTEDFIIDKSLTYTYLSAGREVTESQFDMFRRYELNATQLKELKAHCDKREVVFFSTPTSKRGIDDLTRIGCPLLKNGSDLLVNLPLIMHMAKTGIPTILSTGMATASEIDDAVNAFQQAGGTELIILHCTSSYPTPDSDVNLLKMHALHQAFGHCVGFSDHTWGAEAAIAATVMGAHFIEKHFTTDKNLPGPDHRFSADPAEMKSLVMGVRRVEKMMGSHKIQPTASEKESRISFRLSCAAARDINAGEIIREEDIVYLRPATGLHPRFTDSLVNKKAKKAFTRGQFIHLNEIE